MNEPKFKIGDSVIITGYQEGLEAMARQVGQCAVVKGITNDGEHFWYTLSDVFAWREDWLTEDQKLDTNGFEELFE